jgi:hypothetical protein
LNYGNKNNVDDEVVLQQQIGLPHILMQLKCSGLVGQIGSVSHNNQTGLVGLYELIELNSRIGYNRLIDLNGLVGHNKLTKLTGLVCHNCLNGFIDLVNLINLIGNDND